MDGGTIRNRYRGELFQSFEMGIRFVSEIMAQRLRAVYSTGNSYEDNTMNLACIERNQLVLTILG